MVNTQVQACDGQGLDGTEPPPPRPPSSGPFSHSTSRLQELYYEIVHVLSLMLEDLPQKKQSHSSENI